MALSALPGMSKMNVTNSIYIQYLDKYCKGLNVEIGRTTTQ